MNKYAKSDNCISPTYSEDTSSKDVVDNLSYVNWNSPDGRVFFPASPTVSVLTPGVYEINKCNMGLYFEKIPVRTDGLLEFPDTTSHRVTDEIKKFWDREHIFKQYELTYKRGILLFGPPGSGKSCTIQLIMRDVVERNGIVIKFGNPFFFIEGMRILRQIQPQTPVVVIMEDIDSLLRQFDESEILNILDGINEVTKTVFLATTNYPELLGDRIVNRPSRFDKRFEVGFPCEKSRKMYFEFLIGQNNPQQLQDKLKELDINLNKWVKDTENLSIAHLKELFIQVVIIGDLYEESIETLRSMTEKVKCSEVDEIGFAPPKKMAYR